LSGSSVRAGKPVRLGAEEDPGGRQVKPTPEAFHLAVEPTGDPTERGEEGMAPFDR
jgi:hypothetical protein